jgi:hypothetical protein
LCKSFWKRLRFFTETTPKFVKQTKKQEQGVRIVSCVVVIIALLVAAALIKEENLF